MSTADAAADLAAAQAALTRVTDQLVKLAGDVAAAANASAGLVTSLEAIDADLAVATTASIAAKAAVDKAIVDLTGTPPPPPPPTDDLILERSNVVGPEELPVGALKDALTITAVIKVPPVDGKYRKLVGADGAAGRFGGLCLGITKNAELEAWVDDGQGIRQGILSARIGKRSFASFRIRASATGTKIDDRTIAVTLPNGRVTCDGMAAIGKGVWEHAWTDPMIGAEMPRLRIYRTERTDAEIDADAAEWDSLLDPDDVVTPPGPPPADGLEAVNSSLTQTAISVDTTPRQTWIGYGWGIGSPSAHEIPARLACMQKWPDRFFGELNSQAVRLIDPHNPEFIGQNKAFVDWIVSKGVDTIIASGFYKGAGYSIESLADGIHNAIQAGIPITHCIPQNEPDGGPNPASYPKTPDAQLVPMFKAFRARLDSHGLQRVTILGQEWAHASGGDANHEFDLLDAAGCIPDVVGYGAGHQYGDCADNQIGTDRWVRKGRGQFSNETGYMYQNTAARVLAAMNAGGIVVEISHQAQSHQQGESDISQKLVEANGNRRLPQQQMQIVSKPLLRGSVFRLCHSSDRPAGLDATIADNMCRRAGRNSRVNVACAKRADGRWVILACVAPDPTIGGQTTHQFTVKIPELARTNLTMETRKCTSSGAISSGHAAMVDGYVRFTAAPQEVWSLVS